MSHEELLNPYDLDEDSEQDAEKEQATEVASATTPTGGNSAALEQSMAEIAGSFGGAADSAEVEAGEAQAAAHAGGPAAAPAQAQAAEQGSAAPAQAEAASAPAPAAGDQGKPEKMDEARRQKLLRGQHRGLLQLYRQSKLDEAQVIEKMIAYDRKLNGGEVSVEGAVLLPSLFAAMIEIQVQRARAQAAANATATKTGGPAVDAGKGDAADDVEEALLTEQAGKQAGGGNEVKSEGGAPKTSADSGGAKKTSGPQDLVDTYGTVDEIKRKDLTTDIKVYFVDGLKRDAKKKKTKEERDDVGELPMLTKTTPVHKKVAPLFREIFEEIRENGDWKNILEHPWAYNPRQNRNNPTEWSIHSWGTAIDVNATTNPNDNSGASKRQKEISHYFTDRGFTWLEDSDAMHFQYHSGGASKITDDEIEQIKDGKHSGTGAKELTRDIKKAIGKAEAKLAQENKRKKPRAKTVAKLESRIARMNVMLEKLGAGAGGGGAAAGGATAGAGQDAS